MIKQKTLVYRNEQDFEEYVRASLKAKYILNEISVVPILFHLPQTYLQEEAIGFGRYWRGHFCSSEINAPEILDEAEAIFPSDSISGGLRSLDGLATRLGANGGFQEFDIKDCDRTQKAYRIILGAH